jgi:hypothetical protein
MWYETRVTKLLGSIYPILQGQLMKALVVQADAFFREIRNGSINGAV